MVLLTCRSLSVNPEWFSVTDGLLSVNPEWYGVTDKSVPFNWQEIITRSAVSGEEANFGRVKY